MDKFLTDFSKTHCFVHSASQKMAPEDQALSHPGSKEQHVQYTLTLTSALCIDTKGKGNLEVGADALEALGCRKINAFEKLSLNKESVGMVCLSKRSSCSSRSCMGGAAALMVQSYRRNIMPTAEPGTVHMALVLKE